MPKATQRGTKQYETPQVEDIDLTTKVYGGKAPSKEAVVKSANARGGKRHDAKGQDVADVGVLAKSDRMVNDERVGIRNEGYLVKKGIDFGVNAFFNSLPPGMDIEDQEVTDIRVMQMKDYRGGLGYPGDGWTDSEQSSALDRGRPQTTNYIKSGKD